MPRQTPVLLVIALVAALLSVSGTARAADACIPQQVIDALADCSAVASLPKLPAVNPFQIPSKPQGQGNLPGSARKTKGPAKKLAPRELDAAETTLEGACHRFACENKPAPGDAKATDFLAQTEYVRARIHFTANRFQEAAVLFRAVALRRADTSVGIFATQLYLESLNVLGSTFDRVSCYDDMARDVPTFIDLYCKGDRAAANADGCGILERIQRDILRLRAEEHIRAGDRSPATGDAAYEAGADAYLGIWTKYGSEACENKRVTCERMEEILYNAARAYQAAHLPSKAIAARRVLIDPRYNLHNTELAKKTRYELGAIFQAMGIYDEAASWYETFAQMSPKMDKAPEALQDAVVLRLALGQIDQAIRDADLFSKNYGTWKPAATAQVAFAVASELLERGDLEAAKRRFEGSMGAIDKNGRSDVQIRAHAGLARTLVRLGKEPAAAAEYGKVKALYREPARVAARLDDLEENVRLRALGAAITAVGEATFFLAEEKRRAVDAIRFPTYTGSGRVEDITVYMGTTLPKWIDEKRRAIDEAERAYSQILHLEPVPPPKWVIAAAARVARMQGKLAAELRAAPMPKGWKKQGPSPWGWTWDEIFVRWHESLDRAAEPLLQRAKGAYRTCVDFSVKFQYGDEHSRRCAAWLSSHYPAAYPRLDEIMDRPSRVASGMIEAAPVPEPPAP